MKTRVLAALSLVVLTAAGVNRASAADYKDGQLQKLAKQVDNDLASGALTKPDGDELKGEIARVNEMEAHNSGLTKKSRRDVRQDIRKIQADLTRKEQQAKALGTASPTP